MSKPSLLDLVKSLCRGKGDVKEDKILEDLNGNDSHNQKDSLLQKSHDYEQRISVEIVAEPLTPDAHGHWYSKDTVKGGFESFDKAWKEGRLNMNLFHQVDDVEKKHIELVKHYLVPDEGFTINGVPVKEGTWIANVKWHNQDLFEKRTKLLEDGTTEIGGLSIRGWGKVNPPKVKGE